MRVNHPLRHRLNKSNYMTSQHINVSNRPQGMTMEDTFLQRQGFERQPTIRCQNYFAAGKVLKSSNQLLTITELMAEQLVDSGLCVVALPFSLPSFGTSVYWHAHTEQDAAQAWLRSILVELDVETKTPLS